MAEIQATVDPEPTFEEMPVSGHTVLGKAWAAHLQLDAAWARKGAA